MKKTKTAHPTVGVVIVNWNTREHLQRCLGSFVADGVPLNRIVVVDQGSTDGSLAHVKKRFAGVKTLSLPENRGYSAALNAGASRLASDYLVIANADVEFAKGTIGALVGVLNKDNNVGMVGPSLRDPNGSTATRFSRTGAFRAFLMLALPRSWRGWWRAAEGRYHARYEPFPVRWVEGSFFAVRRVAFDEAGGFDEAFSFYFEDGDFSLRLRQLGYALVHCPGAIVTHVGGASFSQASDRSDYEFYRNCLLFYRKNLYRRYVWLRRVLRFVSMLRPSMVSDVPKDSDLRELLHPLRPGSSESSGPELSPNPLVSVVVPTYERTDCLIRLLDGLERQTYRNFEIIIVDQSKQKDPAKERRYRKFGRKLTVLRPARANRSYAKNLGARNATGDIVLFCDDDIEISSNLIQTHVSAYTNNFVGAVSCRVVEPSLPPLQTRRIQRITWYGRMVPGFQSDVTCQVETLAGQNMSVRRSIWDSIGGFDVSLTGTSIFEEPDLSFRIRGQGSGILFTNASTVHHVPQLDGNDDQKSRSPAKYYHWFHHNEILYFLKNRSRLTLVMAVPFCLLRTVKQSVNFHMNFSESAFVLRGILNGFISYYRLYR